MTIFSSFYSPGNCIPIIQPLANGKEPLKKAGSNRPFVYNKNSEHLLPTLAPVTGQE